MLHGPGKCPSLHHLLVALLYMASKNYKDNRSYLGSPGKLAKCFQRAE